jgi:hypothetical protein
MMKRAMSHGDLYSEVLGPPATVLHPRSAFTPHVDVHLFAPAGGRRHWLLVTSGMSDKPMKADPTWGPPPASRLELCCKLPAVVAEDDAVLVGRELYLLAVFPFQRSTFLAEGHSVPIGRPILPGSTLRFWLLAALDDPEDGWADALSRRLPGAPPILHAVGIGPREREAIPLLGAPAVTGLVARRSGLLTEPTRLEMDAMTRLVRYGFECPRVGGRVLLIMARLIEGQTLQSETPYSCSEKERCFAAHGHLPCAWSHPPRPAFLPSLREGVSVSQE